MAGNSASNMADTLWPYLIKRVQGVSRNGNGGSGSAISGGRLATLRDVNLDTPTDGQVLTYDSSTQMWRNEDPTGGGSGGPTYVAGNGIAISGTTLSTKQQAAGGIDADTNGLYIKKPTNSGLVVDSTGIHIGEGIGIDILGSIASVDMTELVDTTQGLGVNSNKATVRLTTAGGLKFNPGDGSLRVDEADDFAWTGTHSFTADIQLDADLDFIGAQSITTSGGALTIIPATDLMLNPSGDDVFILGGSRIGTDTYASQLTGWRIDYAGSGDFRYLYTDELHAKAFIADLEQALAGGQIITKSVTILAADFTAPGPGGAATLIVKDLPSANNMAVFQSGDIVRLRQFSRAGGSLNITNCWGVVTAYVDGPGAGEQSWTFTRSVSPNAGAMTTGTVIAKDAILLDYGTSGNGYYEVNAIDGVYAANSPYAQVVTWTGHPATGSSLRLRIGNLAGVSDAALSPSGYGLYSDNAYLHGVVRTAETIMDDDGLALEYNAVSTSWLPGAHAMMSWWPDLSSRTGHPPASIAAYQLAMGSPISDRLEFEVRRSDTSDYAYMSFFVVGEGVGSSSNMAISSTGHIYMNTVTVDIEGNVEPAIDMTYSLGSASRRWATLYADQIIVSGAVSGDAIGGQTWSYPGSMVIDAHTAGSTTVSVTNSGAGTANFDVEGNITLGGTVDGVDISAHVANPSAHHAPVTAGGGIAVVGQVVSLASAAAGGGLTLSAGVLAVGAGSGILVSADSIAIDPSYAMPATATLNTTAPLAGGGLLSSGLTLSLTLAPTGGLSPTGGLGLAPTVAGLGLTLTAGVLDVGVGAGLVAGADSVTLAATLAGNGLTLAAGVLAVGAGDGLVANADTMALDPLVGGAGLTYTAGVLAVGAGAGIQVNANSVQVLLASPSGLNTTSGLAVDATLAGAGLLLTAGVLDVRVSNGLEIVSDLVRVNQAYGFAWTGNQTWAGNGTFNTGVFRFNTAPQVNANLDFIGGSRTITGSAGLTLQPAANLTLDPTGGIVYLPDDVEQRSATFADLVTGINGFRLWTTSGTARQLVIGSIKTDNLTAKAFTTDLTRLEQGDSYWGKGYGTVETAFTLPSIGVNINVWFDNVPNFAGQIFSVGDKLQCRIVNWTTGISLKLIWFNVAAFVAYDDPNFRQQWTITRLSGGTGGVDVIGKGNVMEDAGDIGQGWIHVTSMSGGPYMEFGTQTGLTGGVPQFTQFVRIGQLSGTVDYTATAWGFAAGKNLAKLPDDSSNPFSGLTMDSVKGMRLFNTAFSLYNVGNAVLTVDNLNGISFEHGTNLFNTIGWYEDLGVPPAAPAPSKLLSTVGVARAIAGYTELDLIATGIAGSYSTGAVKLRAVDSVAGNYNAWLDSSGIYFGTGTGARPQTGGFITDAIQYFSGNLLVGTTSDSSPASRLYVYKSPPPGGSNERVATLRMTATSPNTTRTTTVLSVESAPGGTGFNNVAEIGIDIALRAEQAVGRPLALRANQGDVQVLAGWLGVGMTPTMPLDVLGAAHINGNTWVGNATVDTTPSSRLYVYKTPSVGTADERAATIYLSGNTTTATRTMTVLYLQSNPGGTGVGSNNEVGIDIALRGIQAAGRPIALHADNGDLILDNGRIGVGVSPTHPLHLYSNNASIAGVGMLVEQAGAGDARIQFLRATQNWVIGVDGSNNDVFAISPSTDLSTGSSIGLSYRTNGMLGINNNNPGAYLQVGPLTPTVQAPSGIWVGPNAASTGVMVVNTGAMTMGMLASSNGNGYLATWTNHPLIFRTNNADRITIAAAGAVTVAGLLTASSGINLGNTTLSDYDTAAWTPALLINGSATGIGYNQRRGQWTRIGNTIFVWGYIQLSGKGSTTGSISVTGLPIASNSNTAGKGSVYFINMLAAIASVVVGVTPGTATISFWASTTSGPQVVSNTDITNSTILDFAFSYFV